MYGRAMRSTHMLAAFVPVNLKLGMCEITFLLDRSNRGTLRLGAGLRYE